TDGITGEDSRGPDVRSPGLARKSAVRHSNAVGPRVGALGAWLVRHGRAYPDDSRCPEYVGCALDLSNNPRPATSERCWLALRSALCRWSPRSDYGSVDLAWRLGRILGSFRLVDLACGRPPIALGVPRSCDSADHFLAVLARFGRLDTSL